MVTDEELGKLHVRNQEAIKRYAATGGAAGSGWSAYYSAQPTPAPQRLRRAGTWRLITGRGIQITHFVALDWLREFVYFKDMSRKDHYAKQRLGYSASNIFVLSLSQY